MTTHVLKVKPPYYEALASGAKTFEVRRNDRAFQAGDLVELVELAPDHERCDPSTCEAMRRRLLFRRITFVFSGDPSLRDCGGIVPGYVVLGLGDPS